MTHPATTDYDMHAGLPVVDVSGLAAPDSTDARAAAAALVRAYEDVGFAYIAGHGVAETTVAAAFDASRAFHASPLARKLEIKVNQFHRGYLPVATSTLVTSSVAKVTRPNLSESLMLMHEVAPGDADFGRPLQGPNQWPHWLPAFRPAIEAYEREMAHLSRRLLSGFAVGLGLAHDWFEPMFRQPTTFLRLLHYPPQPVDADGDQFGAAPHTDYGALTVLAQDETGGLEVRTRAGTWIQAPPMPGRFIVNVADIMPPWTNGRFVSTPHRVVNRAGRDRYSIAYFFDPSMDAMIECLPTCRQPDVKPRHDPFRYGDYLLDRLNRNYDYRQA